MKKCFVPNIYFASRVVMFCWMGAVVMKVAERFLDKLVHD
jgi:hypothetical protein